MFRPGRLALPPPLSSTARDGAGAAAWGAAGARGAARARLTLRGTFIDVVHDGLPGGPGAAELRPRSSSAPPGGAERHARKEASGVFDVERAYVAELSATIWGTAAPGSPDDAAPLKHRSARGSLGDDEGSLSPVTTCTGPSASSMSRDAAEEDAYGGEQRMVVANEASMGHPQVCSRPCMYFATGNCAKADDCEFCHMPHPKRPAHLQKKHREMLAELPEAAARAMVLAQVRKKVLALDASAETHRVLDRLVSMYRDASAAPWSATTEREVFIKRSVNAVLSSISLRLLVITLQRLVPSSAQGADEAAELLLQRMRLASHTLLAL